MSEVNTKLLGAKVCTKILTLKQAAWSDTEAEIVSVFQDLSGDPKYTVMNEHGNLLDLYSKNFAVVELVSCKDSTA